MLTTAVEEIAYGKVFEIVVSGESRYVWMQVYNTDTASLRTAGEVT